ncbi:hypothetical protein PIB30_094218 [Stylosanthes scabra]|uniref:Uncharacterized protein n=1 Tax=Stylosanthes scabra TaxID=79078 RepID=A0ABU6SVR7_9FABA|nr:hypothetical protein [Stylosanthes scabra]
MAMTENNLDESVPFVTDVVGKVLGEEHSGRVRCMGIGATPTNTFSNAGHHSNQFANPSTLVSSNKCCHDEHKSLLTALKAYFLSKEGCIPSEFAGILGRDAHVTEVDSEHDTPTTTRRSSGGSNENHEDNA